MDAIELNNRGSVMRVDDMAGVDIVRQLVEHRLTPFTRVQNARDDVAIQCLNLQYMLKPARQYMLEPTPRRSPTFTTRKIPTP
jgi:hypothetical protein